MASLANALIGEYRLTESLGAGGMGEVYKAVHMHLGRVIAVKVLSPNLTDGPALLRFYNEASIQASLRHPSVAEYLGFHEYHGRPCILMEYVDGETLAAIIRRRGALPPPEAAGILRDIASAIAHFHAQGVVHRDLKTSNIKITTSGQVKILDFGIARHQRSDRLTHLGAVVGTTESLAPEQVRGEPAGFPTDVWQLGVMFYELLTGRLPFQADSPHEIYQRILAADYVPVRKLQPDAPDAILRIVSRCLQKAMSRRYPTAAELHQALCLWEQSKARSRRPWLLFLRRHRAWSALVVLLILAAIISVMLPGHRAPDNGSAAIDTGSEGTGVASSSTDAAIKTITIDTMDGPAQVFREGKTVGSTPYKVDARMGDGVNLILRRDGFEDLAVQFDVTERHVYTYILKPRKDPQMLWFRKKTPHPAAAKTAPETAMMAAPVACMLTDPGCHRELNEDCARIVHLHGDGPGTRGLLAIVADGMGGHQAGEVASRTAVETIAQEYAKAPGTPGDSLQNAFQKAHQAILKLAKSSPDMEGMGTTCTALAIAGHQAWVAHVGDSRLYLVREGQIYQLTEDHTQCMEMVRRGLLTLEDAKRHTDRNVLIHAMGTRENLTLMTWPESMEVKPRDVFVLCSDGLHDLVSNAEIQYSVWNAEPAAACRKLIQTARDRGGHDNITLVVIAVPSGIDMAALKETGQYEVCI